MRLTYSTPHTIRTLPSTARARELAQTADATQVSINPYSHKTVLR